MKTQATDREKIFATCQSDKGVVTRIYKKNSYNSIVMRKITQFKNGPKIWIGPS